MSMFNDDVDDLLQDVDTILRSKIFTDETAKLLTGFALTTALRLERGKRTNFDIVVKRLYIVNTSLAAFPFLCVQGWALTRTTETS